MANWTEKLPIGMWETWFELLWMLDNRNWKLPGGVVPRVENREDCYKSHIPFEEQAMLVGLMLYCRTGSQLEVRCLQNKSCFPLVLNTMVDMGFHCFFGRTFEIV